MNFDENTEELIERFLNGEMTEVEQEVIKDRINADPLFAQRVAVQMAILRAVSLPSDNEIEQFVEVLETNKRSKQSRVLLLIIGFIVVLLVVLSHSLIKKSNNDETPNDKIVAEFLAPPPKSLILDSDDAVQWQKVAYDPDMMDMKQKTSIQEGIIAFYKKEYDKTITLLNSDLKNIEIALFYRSLAYFNKKEYIVAIENLEALDRKIENNDDLMFETRWYLALSYIQNNEIQKAEKMLKLLVNSEKYGTKAKQITEKLENKYQ